MVFRAPFGIMLAVLFVLREPDVGLGLSRVHVAQSPLDLKTFWSRAQIAIKRLSALRNCDLIGGQLIRAVPQFPNVDPPLGGCRRMNASVRNGGFLRETVEHVRVAQLATLEKASIPLQEVLYKSWRSCARPSRPSPRGSAPTQDGRELSSSPRVRVERSHLSRWSGPPAPFYPSDFDSQDPN